MNVFFFVEICFFVVISGDTTGAFDAGLSEIGSLIFLNFFVI